MNISQSKKTAILRIINSEIRENNLDPRSYSQAVKKGLSDRNLTMKHYYKIRFLALAASTTELQVPAQAVQKMDYASTSHCASYFSSRSSDRELKNRKELSQKHTILEKIFANMVLTLGSVSTILALWLYTGNTISTFFYILLVGAVAAILTLPSLMARLNVLPYLSSVSVMCVLVAISSFASGMKLMKDNPSSEPNFVELNAETPMHKIQFGVVKSEDLQKFKQVGRESANITTN